MSGGTLSIGNGGTAGSLGIASIVTLGKGAELVFDRSDSYGGIITNIISGSGEVVVNGGYLALGGENTYSGTTTINQGTLEIANNRVKEDITFWGVLTIHSNATFVSSANCPFGYPSQTLQGVDKLISFFVNGGILSYSNGFGLQFKDIRFAGGTVLTSGRLIQYGDISVDDNATACITGTGRLNLRKPLTDTIITIGESSVLTIGVPITADNDYIHSATLGLIKKGSGNLVLAEANTYAGTTFIQEGCLTIGSGGMDGTLGTGSVSNLGSIVFNRSDNYDGAITNNIGGTGSLTLCNGILALAGTNTYSGATIVSNGTLRLHHSQALDEETELFVSSGAQIDLDFAGICTVKTLTVNGVLMIRNKIYSADNFPDIITGEGELRTINGATARGTVFLIN